MFKLDAQKLLKMSNEEIFGEEKKYRPLFISFFVALCVLTSIFLTAAILANIWWVDPKTVEIIEHAFNNQTSGIKIPNLGQYRSMSLTSRVVIPYLIFSFSLIITVVFAVSLFSAYKNKDFTLISFLPMFVIGFIAFYSVLNFVGLISNFQTLESSLIVSTVGSVLTIFVWFFISRHVSLLRRCCTIAKINQQRAEMFGAAGFGNPNMNINNPNPNFFQENTNNSQVEELKTEDVDADIIDDKYRKKLQSLSLKEIRQIAEKLSISGCEEMSKKKLIELILQISAANNSNNKEKAKKTNVYDNPETIEEIEIDEGA